MSAETRYWLLRTGSMAAILGSILSGVGNGVHPVTPRDEPEGVARVIADSDAWTLIHVIILVGIVLMLIGIVAFRHSIEGGRAEALARLGAVTGTIGATIGLITIVLDGVAAKQLADAWAAAPEADKSATLGLVSTNETINFALAGLFNMMFAGVPFTFLGLAVAQSGAFPRWFGWIGALAGVGSIGAGIFQMFTGKPTVASLVLTIIGPTVIVIWTLMMGVMVGRRAAQSRSPQSSGTS
ncbi:MAG: DUF4386 family protein [Acidimicrobiia bacterium]